MILRAMLLTLASSLPATAEEVAVPSGQPVSLLEVIRDTHGPSGLTYRFRFVAPEIAGGAVSFETASADMHFLCESYAIPRVSSTTPPPNQIVISLSDRPLAFGDIAPEVTQFFEAYRPENGACIAELF